MLDFFKKQKKIKKIIDDIVEKEGAIDQSASFYIGLDNVASNVLLLLIVAIFKETNQTIVLVTPNIYDASKAYDSLLEMLSEEDVAFFPGEETVASDILASSNTFRLARMQTLVDIVENKSRIIVTNTEGVTRNIMSKKRLKDSLMTFRQKDIIKRDELIESLITRGYKRCAITEAAGSFSVRGSVIDIYGINHSEPIRLSFNDDEIENIKVFSVETQKSTMILHSAYIYPVYEMHYSFNQIDEIIAEILKHNKMTKKIERDITNLKKFQNLDQLYYYLPYIDENYQSFLTSIDSPIVVYDEFSRILDKEKMNIFETYEYFEKMEFISRDGFFTSVEEGIPLQGVTVFSSLFSGKKNQLKMNINYDLKTSNNFDYNNNLKHLIEDIKLSQDKTYIITSQDATRHHSMQDILKTNDVAYLDSGSYDEIKKGNINLIIDKKAFGYVDYGENYEVITPYEIARSKVRPGKKYQNIYKDAIKIYAKEEINIGDYVVHRDYGIGKYRGITTKQLKNVINDYLWIEYSGDSNLYIPVENIYVLEKYIGNKDKIPKLNNLAGKEWARQKAKIKEKIDEIAKALIKTQAQRELLKGYQYQKDSQDQKVFEADFPFLETEGQIKAINEFKADLESTRPVDRLLCGDVGYGKTEVALRGAFKVVEAGKQVAYMAPTTVLARQHYQTFKERFEKYGVRVELLSRFVDQNTVKNALVGLENGYVDIVIGTHRILSDDIKFKDLGLLIIDEEHRFGVAHKEKIKKIKSNIDVFSLSATPIPRTLQLALTGLRDLSLIETPPYNRLSVQTYVLESNDSVIREAIRREIGRGGQVFYLLNRIRHLDQMARKVKRLVPEAKITMIHGRMSRDEIEESLNSFLDETYNVLICTTIIETGIDIPNANTIIIERSDILGLAQLYQIRGRVGRSDRIAYAYLMYDEGSILTETAQKRLQTIKEFASLGSGYKIAMRDLSIRGAGDILGSEQSGFIDAIGMDLYLKMLNEAIDEEKGIIKTTKINPIYDLQISRHISEKYVDDDVVRIDMHQEINKISSREQAENVRLDFIDRYGTLDDLIDIYIEGKYLTFLLKSNGVASFREINRSNKGSIEFHFDEAKSNQLKYDDLKKWQQSSDLEIKFNYKHHKIFVEISLKKEEQEMSSQNYIYKLTKLLETI